MTIEEYMKKYKVSYKQVWDRIQKGELPAVKKGKVWEITMDMPPSLPDQPKSNLKDKFLEVQIEEKQSKIEKYREEVREEYKSEVLKGTLFVLSEFKKCLASCNLDANQNRKIKECIENILTKYDSA